MAYNADNNHKRCAVCDFCKETDGGPSRSFIWDDVMQEWNCDRCQKEIQYAIEDAEPDLTCAYWIKHAQRPPTDAEFSKREYHLEDISEPVDPLQANLNAYTEVDDGS